MPIIAPDQLPVHCTRDAVSIGPATPAALPQRLVQPDTRPVAPRPRSCVDGQIDTCVTPIDASDTHSSTIINGIPGARAARINARAPITKPPTANGTRAVQIEPVRRRITSATAPVANTEQNIATHGN